MSRVLCALSGGVDSSVAAALLVAQGHEVVGVFLRNGIGADGTGHVGRSCCSASDARDAQRVADRLGIAFYALDYAEEFDGLVGHFVDEYRRGRTPSPCVLCNQDLKFGKLFALADSIGAKTVATGHYARLVDGALRRAVDRAKDQSYFLFGIHREVLDRVLFPLGELSKPEVRERAREAGLATADKPESMEICFVPGNDYRTLVETRGGLTPGRFVDGEGRELGACAGVEGYTIGQRRGLPALGSPRYVVAIRPERHEVVLGPREDLARRHAVVENCRWLVPEPCGALRAAVQIRAHHEAAMALLEPHGAGGIRLRFDSPQEAVTPGQAAVFYDGDRVLGGGWLGFPGRDPEA